MYVFHTNQDFEMSHSEVEATAIPRDDQEFSVFCDTK
jgi:hypothetical protein